MMAAQQFLMQQDYKPFQPINNYSNIWYNNWHTIRDNRDVEFVLMVEQEVYG